MSEVSEVKTIQLDSTVRSHKTPLGIFGVVESKNLTAIIGKHVIAIQYEEKKE